MSLKKIVPLFLLVLFLVFDSKTLARVLKDEEKTRLYNTIKAQSYLDLTIDVSFIEAVLTRPEAVNKIRQAMMEETKRLRTSTNDDSITLESVGIALSDGSETRLSEKRIRIGSPPKIRIDTTIFANEEMTETNYEGTTINSLFDVNAPSYQIDHKLKQAFINNLRWSGRDVVRFGKVDEDILMAILSLCSPKRETNIPRNKEFSYKGTHNIDGKMVDEIECTDPNAKVKYSIFLDSNDWGICRKMVRYDTKSGLPSKIVEYKEFTKAGGSGELFPHLVIRRYFDKGGGEEKLETVYITNVVFGLPISEDIFKFNVPSGYVISDMRPK